MEIQLSAQILGELIEQNYNYMLAKTVTNEDGKVKIILHPVKDKPHLMSLHKRFETYYRITQEPLQMLCGVDETNIVVEYGDLNEEQVSISKVLDDSYFRMDEDFFRQVLESIEDYVIFTVNNSGKVNSWNTGAEKILGYSDSEIMGEHARLFYTKEDQQADVPENEMRTALDQGRAINERYHVRKDGSTFWGSGLVFPLKEQNGTVRGFTKIMRNLRERKEAEKLAQVENQK